MAFSILTPRFNFEMMNEGQQSGDVIYNENANRLDILANATIIDHTVSAQPGGPSDGDVYVVAATATGTDWEGQDDNIAYYDAGWYFVAPFKGFRGWIESLTPDTLVVFDGTNWVRWNGSAWVTAF